MASQLWGLHFTTQLEGRLSTLPLLGVRASASLKEFAAQVTLVHTYANDTDQPLEATYSFPIPARAAVCAFTIIKQDGSRVAGRVKEMAEARRTYETAVSVGQRAALVEQVTPDGFRMAVGNIQPNEKVQIELGSIFF
ncbi:vault protein inter-alpha-trypsin domain-containing protein [Mycena amicta]|nr:vault protein inter-alpha-trypsin domain-containing protein [Mycena amicta]